MELDLEFLAVICAPPLVAPTQKMKYVHVHDPAALELNMKFVCAPNLVAPTAKKKFIRASKLVAPTKKKKFVRAPK